MKYVALKDGSIMTFYDNADYMQYDNVRENFLKEGDTLEELCDEFVVVFEDKNHIVYSQFKWAMDKAIWSGMPFMIYGAIWTDKGLIYVAKLNENGKLELI